MSDKFKAGDFVRTTYKKNNGTKYFGRIVTANGNNTYDVDIQDWNGSNENSVRSGVLEDNLEYPWEDQGI